MQTCSSEPLRFQQSVRCVSKLVKLGCGKSTPSSAELLHGSPQRVAFAPKHSASSACSRAAMAMDARTSCSIASVPSSAVTTITIMPAALQTAT